MPKPKSLKPRPGSAEDKPVEPALLLKEFAETGILGVGAYGSVHKAKHSLTGHTVAIKKIVVDRSDPIRKLSAEINILRELDNRNIIKYLGSFYVKPTLNIVMEYCEAGSVADIMRLRRKTMLEPEIANIMQGTLHGLQYMHSKRQVHRDIKGGNVLLTRSGIVKLADFGVAGQLSEKTQKRKTVIGTPFWMAPEVIDLSGHDSLADIWSFGILGIEMAKGTPPYSSEIHPMRAMHMIVNNPPPKLEGDQWSAPFRAVLDKCLVKEPRKRATASALLKMPFIKSAKSSSDVLAVMISEVTKIMEDKLAKEGSLAQDESGDATLATASTMVPTEPAADSTLVASGADETLVEPLDLGTMVVNEDADGASASPGGDQPAFMKRFLEVQAAMAAESSGESDGSGTSTPTLITREIDLTDLRRRLDLLAGGKSSKMKKSRPT